MGPDFRFYGGLVFTASVFGVIVDMMGALAIMKLNLKGGDFFFLGLVGVISGIMVGIHKTRHPEKVSSGYPHRDESEEEDTLFYKWLLYVGSLLLAWLVMSEHVKWYQVPLALVILPSAYALAVTKLAMVLYKPGGIEAAFQITVTCAVFLLFTSLNVGFLSLLVIPAITIGYWKLYDEYLR